MIPPRPSQRPEPAILSHEDIVARELAVNRRRRIRRWVVGILLAALALGIAFGGRPALHAIKAWQARRLASDARRLIDQGKWLDARKDVADAYALSSQEPDAVRVTAQFLNRVGNFTQALGFWKQLESLHALTPGDQADFANAELGPGDLDSADGRLRLAWPAGTPGTLADWKVGMQLAMRREPCRRRRRARPAHPRRLGPPTGARGSWLPPR